MERRNKGIKNIIVALVVLLVILILFIFTQILSKSSNEGISHTLEVEQKIDNVFSLVQDIETGQRGFLLTGNETYLVPFLAAIRNHSAALYKLEALTNDNLLQQKNIAELKDLIARKIKETSLTVELKKAGNPADALAVVNTHEGKAIMVNIRQLKNEMLQEEGRLLIERINKNNIINIITVIFIIISLIVLGIILYSIFAKTLPLFAELHSTREKLRTANIQLTETVQDLSDEVSRRSESEQQNKNLIISLEEKNRELNHFAYIASHDLQEPLRTVSNFIEVFKEDYEHQLDKQAHEYFDFINGAVERMRNLIKNLLNFSRIGSSGPLETLDINLLLKDVLDNLSATMQAKKATLESVKLPIIAGYRQELMQLLQNLISNGIKFVKPGERPLIRITCTENEQEWTFAVADNGIGIPPGAKAKIFDMFTRLHSSSEYEGQGIGLTFCRKIISLHGGTLLVESETGQGSTFFFTISKSLTTNTQWVLGREKRN